ncbi:MAG TPA: PH domain-containing protein [Mycobacteriales bacterium]|nr:PH domain-containing protein [Mycobacteriales bacterium]
MAYPKKLLEDGEEVVLDLHPHWRVLFIPALLVPVVVGAGAYLATLPDGSSAKWVRLAILVAALLILIWGSLIPYLKWLTTHYVLTNRRIAVRVGVLARTGRDVPLTRVNDVTFQHTVIERLFRSGTLTIESAGERGQVVLEDVPKVEDVQRTIYSRVEAEDQRRRISGPVEATEDGT